VRLYLLFAAVVLCGVSLVFAQVTITAERIPGAIADGGGGGTIGFPYAVFVRIQNWTAAASSQAYVKIYSGSFNEYMWSQTGVWSSATTYSTANQPVITLDAGGNWSGWIYAKHNTSLGVAGAVRAARVGATGTNLTSAQKTFTILGMTGGGNGGWLVRTSSPAVNKPILAYAAGLVVGSYRTEDNGITEGYAYGPGGFKIALPAGIIDSLVTLNEDGSRDRSFAGPWNVIAGLETDAAQTGATFGPGTAIVVPSILPGGKTQNVTVKIAGEAAAPIQSCAVILPRAWAWSRLPADVTVTAPGSPVVAINGDTVLIGPIQIGATDTAAILFSSLIPQDTTGYVVIGVLTGFSADSLAAVKIAPSVFLYGTPTPIAVARENDASGVPLRLNSWVTVRGIVTVANEFGGPSYLQDNSGGLAVFGATFSTAVSPGDEVIVSGLVQPFNGLCEIVTPILHATVSQGNAVDPLVVTAFQVQGDGGGGLEQYEGRLVRLNGVTVTGSGAWAANTNYPLLDATGSAQLRIDNTTDLVGVPMPASIFDIIGVVGQFIGQVPFIGGYQVMPRSTRDIISSGPIIASVPVETDIQPTALAISWRTVNPGSTQVWYGATRALELGLIGDSVHATNHVATFQGLRPATVYYLQAFSVAGSDTSFAPLLISSTSSPAQATGEINVYFNKSVNSSVAWQQPASGNQNLVNLLLRRISGARRTIDAALYSLSGTPGPGTDIATALIAAKQRGVRVRMICENDNRNTSPFNTLVANGIPLITDTFDPVNNGAGLMHNKFFVIDARGGAPESVWVWTGSWNPTDPGTNNDYQNAIEIQDPSFAQAFLMEFDEMWGSGTDMPNGSASRFGVRKSDNTPHRFIIRGKRVECYFSPSDQTTAHLVSAIDSARHSVAFALLTLTRADIRTSIVNRKAAGLKVRGVLDNNTDSGSQYGALVGAGIDVRLKSGPDATTYLLHHKYGILDAEDPAWNPVVITGSHNWTNSAESSNNENLLIMYDHGVANQYLQEFAARYFQYGGSDTIRVSVEVGGGELPQIMALDQNFPNPFNPETSVKFSLPDHRQVTLEVFDLLGRRVATLIDEAMQPGVYVMRFDGSRLASGMYIVRLKGGGQTRQRKMLLMR
jgi:phosphatidylserine/phosphatidylglycerophosphate/cardiolipin synthase-like enzyme